MAEIFTESERTELRRMLAAFKAELPPHELGDWFITSQPAETVIDDQAGRGSFWHRSADHIRVRGHATCLRCHKRFEIPDSGNFTTFEERLDATVKKAKEWVGRIAAQDGPCWGDVPRLPLEDCWGATPDLAAAYPVGVEED